VVVMLVFILQVSEDGLQKDGAYNVLQVLIDPDGPTLSRCALTVVCIYCVIQETFVTMRHEKIQKSS
jgi:hypothetical protein